MFNLIGRYRVDEVVQEEREDCYISTLYIKDAASMDSRAYYLAVENDKGKDRHAIQLYVNGKLLYILINFNYINSVCVCVCVSFSCGL